MVKALRILVGGYLLRDLRSRRLLMVLTVLGVALGAAVGGSIVMLQRGVTAEFDEVDSTLVSSLISPIVSVSPDMKIDVIEGPVPGRIDAALASELVGRTNASYATATIGTTTALVAGASPTGEGGAGGGDRVGVTVVGVDCGDALTSEWCPAEGSLHISQTAAEQLSMKAGEPIVLAGSVPPGTDVDEVSSIDDGGVPIVIASGAAEASELLGGSAGAGAVTTLFRLSSEPVDDDEQAVLDEFGLSVGGNVLAMPPALVTVDQALASLTSGGTIIALLIVLTTSAFLLNRRRQALYLLRVSGALRRTLLLAVAVEAIVIGLVAAVVALPVTALAGSGLVSAFGDALLEGSGHAARSSLDSFAVQSVFGAAVGGALLGSLIPAWRALRGSPDSMLRRDRSVKAASLWLVVGGVVLLVGAFVIMGVVGAGRIEVSVGQLGLFAGIGGVACIGVGLGPRLLGRTLAGPRGGRVSLLLGRADVMGMARLASTVAVVLGLGVGMAVAFGGLGRMGADSSSDLMASLGDRVLVSPRGPWDQAENGFDPERVVAAAEAGGDVRYRTVMPDTVEPRVVVGAGPGTPLADALVEVTAGSLDELDEQTVALSTVASGRFAADVGDVVTLPTVSEGEVERRVVAVFEPLLADDSGVGDWVLVLPSVAVSDFGAYASQILVDPSTAEQWRSEGLVANFWTQDSWAQKARPAWERYFRPFVMTGQLLGIAAALGVLNMVVIGRLGRRGERARLHALGMTRDQERGGLAAAVGAIALVGTLVAWLAVLVFTRMIDAAAPVYYGFDLNWQIDWVWLPIAAIGVVVGLLVAALVAHAVTPLPPANEGSDSTIL